MFSNIKNTDVSDAEAFCYRGTEPTNMALHATPREYQSPRLYNL